MGRLENVVVVGASLAGLRAVEALRRRGYDGRIAVIGAESQRPYDRPPLSKEVLTGKWDEATTLRQTALRKPESWDELAADWRLGVRARALDGSAHELHLDNGESLHFDGLVIATGATPRRLPGTPDLAGIHVLRSFDDALAIRAALEAGARVCVVGAGFIGAEVAASARSRRLDVAMVEALPVPLERAIGAEMGKYLADLHRDQGVDLRCGVGVSGFEGGARVGRVLLEDGSRIEADLVVIGIGVAPETGWLEGSGLRLADGVVCDERCAAAPDVVAAGDVARWSNPLFGESMRIEHWTNATEQADAAVNRLLDGPEASEPYAPVPYFWSDQYDVKIQSAGRPRPDDEVQLVDGSLEERRFVLLYGREGRVTGVLGFNRPRLVMKWRRAIREGTAFPPSS